MASHAERIQQILEKLAQARERGIETFGAKKHRFVLSPPASEATVSAFEQREGVRLPDDFRAFLTTAGQSGAGPYYGLLPVDRFVDICIDAARDWANKPFVFSPDMPQTYEAYEAAVAGIDEPFQGAIAIAELGCAYYAGLVVTGAYAGRVVYVCLDGGVPFFVEGADFLSWYERWLDELLAGHKHFWFGMDMPGDEAVLVTAARGPRRLDALHAMRRLPGLSPEAAAVVAMRVHDEEPRVRAAALDVVAKLALPGLEEHVRRALDDREPEVRKAALAALIALGHAWHEDARRLMKDEHDGVASSALRELVRARAISGDELIAVFENGGARREDAALTALRDISSARAIDVLLARARTDERLDVVHALLAGVRTGAATDAQRDGIVEVLLARLERASSPESAVICGLGDLASRHPRALRALLDVTKHPDGFARFHAAAALGNVAGAEAVEALKALSKDETMPRDGSRSTAWSVGANAKKALDKLRGRLR